MKPVGALTRAEVLAVVHRHGIIYKVRKMRFSSIQFGIIKVETKEIVNGSIVATNTPKHNIMLARWFKQKPPIGYLFDNYFHALAFHMNNIQSNKQ